MLRGAQSNSGGLSFFEFPGPMDGQQFRLVSSIVSYVAPLHCLHVGGSGPGICAITWAKPVALCSFLEEL
jgi:hypothetical protein